MPVFPRRDDKNPRQATRPAPAELLLPDESRRLDQAAAEAGVSLERLMAAAGRAVARAAMRRWRPRPVVVLAGPGNNGGDGWVAARLLEEAGWPVAVAAFGMPPENSVAAEAAGRWRGVRVPFSPEAVGRAGLVIDALFGAGLSRDLPAEAEAVLRAIRAPILAVDVPSGLDGATGQVRGFAPEAAVTVALERARPGHVLLPGRDLCGALEVVELGFPPGLIEALRVRCWRNGPALWRLPVPGAAMHKHSRGHVVVAAGATMPGAARLAAAGARRAGAGLVTVAATTQGAAFLLRGVAEAGDIIADPPAEALVGGKGKVWVLGPGMVPDDRARDLLAKVMEAGDRLVVDAGGLTLCAGAPERLRGASIITPHGGEFGRVFGPLGDLAQTDKPEAARQAASLTGAVVVLKGSDTVVAAPDGRVAINSNAPPTLATAGSGDVLSGICGAMLGQGLEPFEAAAAAVWLHGAAAPTGAGVVAEDVAAGIPRAFAQWTETYA
ncbi:NAD(P)H-hydrate dehydratase [Roseomonas elaeocarpi]|uniref:Bifunctional NAD(P)H-hydrate repair enzyme n=1 Tax=Roseomonas elaeocarpi TaxID=907779 RepID=A0ABV6JUZ5_9PROT